MTVLGDKVNVAKVCRVFGLSRQAYYDVGRAVPRAEEPSGSRQERTSWSPTPELDAAILRIVEAHPHWGCHKVWALLRTEAYGGLRCGINRVWKRMAVLGKLFESPRRGAEVPRGTVAVADSNRLWATDMTTVHTREDGLVAVMPVIDCGDRVLLSLRVDKSQESWSLLEPVREALVQEFAAPQGVPEALGLRTDHGPQYTGEDCRELCLTWGLDHTFAPVGRPTGNAVAERFIKTMKVEVIWTRDWRSAAELWDALQAWMKEYNTVRPHQALGWQTPAQRRERNLSMAWRVAA